jgi:hypothetical protein
VAAQKHKNNSPGGLAFSSGIFNFKAIKISSFIPVPKKHLPMGKTKPM